MYGHYTPMKHGFRHKILAERAALSAGEVRKRSRHAQQQLLGSAAFAAAGVVALYAPIRNEVETGDLHRFSLMAGKRVLYPAVSGKMLVFRQVDEDSDLRQGVFGIMEPKNSCRAVDPAEADLIVVPGVAFDMSGRRIGYGKGYYDAALHSLEGMGKLFGICFDFQLVEEIVSEPHDVQMDGVVTEQRRIACRVSTGR